MRFQNLVPYRCYPVLYGPNLQLQQWWQINYWKYSSQNTLMYHMFLFFTILAYISEDLSMGLSLTQSSFIERFCNLDWNNWQNRPCYEARTDKNIVVHDIIINVLFFHGIQFQYYHRFILLVFNDTKNIDSASCSILFLHVIMATCVILPKLLVVYT